MIIAITLIIIRPAVGAQRHALAPAQDLGQQVRHVVGEAFNKVIVTKQTLITIIIIIIIIIITTLIRSNDKSHNNSNDTVIIYMITLVADKWGQD